MADHSNPSENPYAPPATDARTDRLVPVGGDPLASRLTRLAASMIDGILLMIILVPIQFMTGWVQRAGTQQMTLLEQLGMSLLGMVVMFVMNGYWLATRGQTIGKILTRIQIVDFSSGQLLPFVRVYVYRYLWMAPLVIIGVLIPGPVDDLLINFAVLINISLIFGADRRCLHDYLAGSKVVLYRQDRPRLSETPDTTN